MREVVPRLTDVSLKVALPVIIPLFFAVLLKVAFPVIATELEAEFAEMNGWEAEAEAGQMLAGLGIGAKYNGR